MEAKALNYLINYATNMGIIKDMSVSYSDLEEIAKNEGEFSFELNDGKSYNYDFSNPESKNSEASVKAIRKILPICGVIDLINEAVILGIVTDISTDYNCNELVSYDNNYLEITNVNCFYFKINSEMFDDTIYKITFDKKRHDIKNKIEYASRTSLFVDTLMKRIMAKYNILLVRKASWVDEGIPELPLADYMSGEFKNTSDSELATDMIENQLKVLVNYRDNFNNTTCSENVIDDIFVNITGNEIRYGFFKIGKSDDTEPLYDVINDDVAVDDIDSLLRIRNLINDSDVKFNIFETLRNNPNTNLSSLIKSRITEYDEKINTDPKIEFTITPLSIYCNHIVKKTAHYIIKSTNLRYSDYELDYAVEFNPANVKNADFLIYGDGDTDILGKNDKIVIAFDDLATEGKELNPRISSTKYATILYGSSNRYNNELYRDVYFLNESLVKLVDNNILPYDGILDSNTYVKSQIVRGEISGRYMYINDAVEVIDDDILGVDLLDLDKKRYVSKEYARHCDICGHTYGALNEVWEGYKASHIIKNDPNNRSCCDACKNTILPTGEAIIYSLGYKEYYFDNPKELKNTELCIECKNEANAFIFVDTRNRGRGRCKVCNRYYCPSHIDLNTNICINCSGKNIKDTINDPKLIKLIKTNINPIDLLNKDLSYKFIPDENALWVYSNRKNKQITYYFIVDDDQKFIHLIGKNVKRGDD